MNSEQGGCVEIYGLHDKIFYVLYKAKNMKGDINYRPNFSHNKLNRS
jgi:hypothetical protein